MKIKHIYNYLMRIAHPRIKANEVAPGEVLRLWDNTFGERRFFRDPTCNSNDDKAFLELSPCKKTSRRLSANELQNEYLDDFVNDTFNCVSNVRIVKECMQFENQWSYGSRVRGKLLRLRRPWAVALRLL